MKKILVALIASNAFAVGGVLAQTPVTGAVTNINPMSNSFTIQEPAPTNRVTTYSVNKTFTATINGKPMKSWSDMHIGDICSVTVVTPPLAASATCKTNH